MSTWNRITKKLVVWLFNQFHLFHLASGLQEISPDTRVQLVTLLYLNKGHNKLAEMTTHVWQTSHNDAVSRISHELNIALIKVEPQGSNLRSQLES